MFSSSFFIRVLYDESFQTSEYHSENESRKCTKKRNLSDSCTPTESMKSKKRKMENVETNSTKKKKEKAAKHKKLHNSVSVEKIVDQSENFEENIPCKILSHKTKHRKETMLVENVTVDPSTNHNCETFFSFEMNDTTAKSLETNIPSTSKIVKSDDSFDTAQNSNFKSKGLKNQQDTKKSLDKTPEEIAEFEMNGVVINTCPKKKRKRHRKRKNANSSFTEAFFNADNPVELISDKEKKSEKQQQKCESTNINISNDTDSKKNSSSLKDKTKENINRKHIIYACETENNIVVNDDTKNVHNCSSNTFVVKEDLSIVNAPSSKDYPKISTPNQLYACDKPSWSVSLLQSRSFFKNVRIVVSAFFFNFLGAES